MPSGFRLLVRSLVRQLQAEPPTDAFHATAGLTIITLVVSRILSSVSAPISLQILGFFSPSAGRRHPTRGGYQFVEILAFSAMFLLPPCRVVGRPSVYNLVPFLEVVGDGVSGLGHRTDSCIRNAIHHEGDLRNINPHLKSESILIRDWDAREV